MNKKQLLQFILIRTLLISTLMTTTVAMAQEEISFGAPLNLYIFVDLGSHDQQFTLNSLKISDDVEIRGAVSSGSIPMPIPPIENSGFLFSLKPWPNPSANV